MREKEFWALDALRFFLAIYIVLFHTLDARVYQSLAETPLAAILGVGNMATTVFFVLSGFLLTHVYVIQKNGKKINKKSFFLARFSALYPLHIIGFTLASVPTFIYLYMGGRASINIGVSSENIRILEGSEVAGAVFSNIFLLDAWNPYYLFVNAPSWSLSALACYYVIFPYVAPRLCQAKSVLCGLAVLGALFILPGVTADILHRSDLFTEGFLHRNPVIRLPLFLSGILLCALFSNNRRILRSGRSLAVLGLIVVITFWAAAYLRFQGIHQFYVIKNGLYFPAALSLVWIFACAPAKVSHKVKHWSARLGSASLPLFLLHLPLFHIFMKIEKVVMSFSHAQPGQSFSSIIFSARNNEMALCFFPLYVIPLIIICIQVQERFVVPTKMKIKRHFFSRPNSDSLNKLRNVDIDESAFTTPSTR